MHMIGAYRKPATLVELGAAVGLFVREELGLTCEEKREDHGVRLTVHMNGEEETEAWIGSYGNVYVLSDDEMEVVDAMRRGETGYYPNVIAGLRTPKDAEDLMEWLRLVIDVNTPLLANYATAARGRGLEVGFQDGSGAFVGVAGPAEPFPELGACVRLAVEPVGSDDRARGHRRIALEVRVMTRAAWDAMGSQNSPWSGQALDDGRVLAVRATDDYASHCQDVPEEPGRVAAVRDLRGRLLDFLEDCERVSYVDCQAGGNGGATYRLTVEGEATAASPDPIREHLLITLASDPDN